MEFGQTLRESTIPKNHTLWKIAKELGAHINAIDTKEMPPVPTTTIIGSSKTPSKIEGETYRMQKIDNPDFNGDIKNWHRFWVQFKVAVHDNKRLSSTMKLVFLKQAMDDPNLQELLYCETDEGDFYEDRIKFLQKCFDKARDVHAIYCRTLTYNLSDTTSKS